MTIVKVILIFAFLASSVLAEEACKTTVEGGITFLHIRDIEGKEHVIDIRDVYPSFHIITEEGYMSVHGIDIETFRCLKEIISK